MQTYRFATALAGDIVDVMTLETSCKRMAFRCLSCGGTMVARLGPIRDRCFAHYSLGNCSSETYLHVLGKFLFSQAFERCQREGLPFWVGRNREVCSDVYIGAYHVGRTTPSLVSERVDLCRFYDGVKTEIGIGGFIADLLLVDTHGRKKPTCIEIKVTHGLTEEKSRSGLQIIEITAGDEAILSAIQEADLPPGAVVWTGFPNSSKVLRAETTISNLRTYFEPEILRYVMQIGRMNAIQIYWHTHKLEHIAVRGGAVIGVASTLEELAVSAGFSLPPLAKPPVVPKLPVTPVSNNLTKQSYEDGEHSTLLDEVIAIFGGRVLDDEE